MTEDPCAVCPNCFYIMVMQSPELDICPHCGCEVEFDPLYDDGDDEEEATL